MVARFLSDGSVSYFSITYVVEVVISASCRAIADVFTIHSTLLRDTGDVDESSVLRTLST